MSDADYLFALELQNRLNAEHNEGISDSDIEQVEECSSLAVAKLPLRSKNNIIEEKDYLNKTENTVHPEWEILDPTPDITSLFGTFDTRFFQGKLKCVTLEWSKKMYSCAGICYSRSNRFGMDITIRLSEPLLKLRPRKNLVETMLHEMIHAYCFVLHIREGNGGHGPNFKKIMHTINQVAGTNITVYHTFHDEVQLYKQHVWRCNGICQHRAPFFGFVKRTSNRAPGPNDQWWAAHKESCGGYFQKIQEPEKKKKSGSKKKEQKANGNADMRNYFVPNKSNSTVKNTKSTSNTSSIKGFGNGDSSIKGPIKVNGGGTMLLNPKTKTTINNTPNNSIATAFPPTSYPGISSDPFNHNSLKKPLHAPPLGNLKNVKGLKDLNSNDECRGGGNAGHAISNHKTFPDSSMSGRGYSLDSNSLSKTISSNDNSVDRNHLRNIWANRFGLSDENDTHNKNDNKSKKDKTPPPSGDSKRRRISNEAFSDNRDSDVFVSDENKHSKNTWFIVDDDIMLKDPDDEVIALSSDDDSDSWSNNSSPMRIPPIKHMTADERQIAIKKEITDETFDLKDEDIVLIDDEYDDDQDDEINLTVAAELADTSLIDEFFGDDTLLKEFKRENDVVPSGSRYVHNPNDDIITCPICQGKMQRKEFAEHLNGCTGIAIRVKPPSFKSTKIPTPEAKPFKKPRSTRKSAKDILRDAGYSETDLFNITSASSADDEEWSAIADHRNSSEASDGDERPKAVRQRSIYKTTRQCPACAKEIEEDEVNDHLDECLEVRRGRRSS